MRIRNAVSLSPVRPFELVTAMIESILRLGRPMQVDDNLEARLASPVDRFVQVGRRARHVFPLDVEKRPVPDRDANDVKTSILDPLEILETHEGVPVGREYVLAFRLAEFLAECPLVADGPVVAGVLPEDGRRDETAAISTRGHSYRGLWRTIQARANLRC